MNQIENKIVFSGVGMDVDSDIIAIKKGASRYRLNVIEKDGDLGVLTNIRGNTALTGSLPSGTTNKVIGFTEDIENGWGIFFLYNSSGYHSILYSDSTSINYILDGTDDGGSVGSVLNFQTNKYIDAGIIGNEDNRYLVWTDGYNEPRILNITMAVNYTVGSGTPIYTDISSDIIRFYKKPYDRTFDFCAYSLDSSYSGNNVKNNLFQFALRYKYYDKTYSTLSSRSFIPIPSNDTMPSGRLTDYGVYNRISLQITVPESLDVVSEIQLLYRIVDIGDGVSGSWYIYDNYEHTTTSLRTIYFYNDRNIGVISDEESVRIYDYVPLKADHLYPIDSNRIIFGGITEGFDNVDIDVDVSCVESSIPPTSGIQYEDSEIIDNLGVHPTSMSITFSDVVGLDLNYYFYVYEYGGNLYDFTYESSYSVGNDIVFGDINAFVNDLITTHSFELTSTYDSFTNTLLISMAGGSTKIYLINIVVLSATTTYKTLKTGADYKYGLIYHYNGYVGTTQTNEDCVLSTRTTSSPQLDFEDLSSTSTSYYLSSVMNINHQAPIGATGYQIVSFGNNIDYFEEYLVYCNFSDIEDDSSEFTMYTDGSDTIIERSSILNRLKLAYNNGINYGMDIQIGDIIRFIGDFDNTTTATGGLNYDVDLFTSKVEYRVEYVSSTTIKCSYSAINYLDTIFSGVKAILIQIIRKKDVFNYEAQEFSQIYPIVNRNHYGTSSNQSYPSTPAVVNITSQFSDTFKTKQVFINNKNKSDYNILTSTGYYCWMEKPMVSLYYNSYISSYGRLNIVDNIASQKYLNKIRFGGKFLDNSGVNFMTKFDFDDERYLDDRFGKITRIQQKGDTLKVYQEGSVTSFYLNSEYALNTDGSETTAFSSVVLSTSGRRSETDYGCSKFTGYVKSPRDAYFFDIKNGVVIKDTKGGLFSINGDMDYYFKAKSKSILEYGSDVEIYAGWDEENKMLLISFIDLSDLNDPINETLGYSEQGEYWVSYYSFLPEMYGSMKGAYFLSFKSGRPYKHNSNNTRNNFYSSQYGSVVWIHETDAPTELKLYNSIEIGSTGQWSSPTNGDIVIEKPLAMSSRLKPGRFVLQEGIYRSDFLRDMNTTGSAVTNNLFNGRNLRGNEMTIKLYNSNTTQAELNYVTIKSELSK